MYGRRTTSLSRSWHTHPGVPALVRCKRLNQREKETSNSRERHGIAAHRRETGASAVWAYCPVDAIGTLPNRSASRPLMGFGPVFDNATFLPEAADGLGSTHVLRPLVRFDNSGPALFRMFVGGTAMLFGIAYVAVWRDCAQNRPLLVYGTALKYWAFAISLFGFITSTLSLEVLLLFGVGNLIFAVLFTRHLIRPRS
jgi:hypothetical protein